MTPFDAAALVAVLRAFYPDVSIDALARARVERPSVFAGGTLIGAGDRLRLGDGRVFLLIWQGAWAVVGDTSDPTVGGVWDADRIRAVFTSYGVLVADSVIAQWLGYWALWGWKDPGYFAYRLNHAQELVDAGKVPPLPPEGPRTSFPLEPGPLVPADATAVILWPTAPVFESLVTRELAALEGTDGILANAGATIAAFDGAARVEGSTVTLFDPAVVNHVGVRAALEGENPGDLVTASDGHIGIIAATRPDYDEPPPDDTPEPDVRPRPPDDDRPKPPKEE